MKHYSPNLFILPTLLLMLQSCGMKSQEKESAVNYKLRTDGQYLISALFKPSLLVNLKNTKASAYFTDETFQKQQIKKAFDVWLAPVKAKIDQDPFFQEIKFNNNSTPDITVNFADENAHRIGGSIAYFAPNYSFYIGLHSSRSNFNDLLYQVGLGLGLNATYHKGDVYSCEGHPGDSVMCRAERPDLSDDDKNGVLALFCRHDRRFCTSLPVSTGGDDFKDVSSDFDATAIKG